MAVTDSVQGLSPWKQEIYHGWVSPRSLKAAVGDCMKTRNDKVLDLEVSSARKPVQHLETISFVACHQRSYTFHTSPYSRLAGQTSSLYFRPPSLSTAPRQPQGKKATTLGNQSQNYSWLPWQENKLSGQPRKKRRVLFIQHILQREAPVGLPKHIWMI